VNFVDKTLVALADPASRPATFDQTALEQIVSAGYDAGAMGAQGPYSAVFDEFRLGISTEPEGVLDGTLQPVGTSEQTTARFRLTGIVESNGLRVDALWRGSVVARFARAGDPITAVVTNWPTLGTIDAEVAQANGGVLPSNPGVLETQRRARFVAHMRVALDQPNLFDDPALDTWLQTVGARSVGDLLENFVGSVDPGTITVTFAPPAAVSATPQPLPIAAALLVRDAPLSLAELLRESALVRERLRALGAERPADAGLRRTQPVLVIWVIPISVFNDADWPGANPAARRANAGAWLAREGIGLAATP
jgi:hypothetical protein